MLIERYREELNKRKQIEIKDVNQDIIDWLEDLAYEIGCRIDRKEWKSKYNSYVVYDYEPFCAEGFEINIYLSSMSMAHLNFLKYLYENKLNTIKYLDNCVKN